MQRVSCRLSCPHTGKEAPVSVEHSYKIRPNIPSNYLHWSPWTHYKQVQASCKITSENSISFAKSGRWTVPHSQPQSRKAELAWCSHSSTCQDAESHFWGWLLNTILLYMFICKQALLILWVLTYKYICFRLWPDIMNINAFTYKFHCLIPVKCA